MFKSALVKLMMWYIALAMVLSLIFSFVLYHFSTQEIGEGLNNQYKAIIRNDHDNDSDDSTTKKELHARSMHLLQDLVYFNVFVLIGSGFSSYWLARKTLRPIEEAHQAQIRFTAEASHELRTPLTALRADTESVLMQNKNDPKLLKKTLKDNLRDIEKLEKLANHLLEMSKYKSKTTMLSESVDLKVKIISIIEQFKKQISNKKVAINFEGKSVKVNADPIAIGQLISIVLDNAIKYSRPKGQIKVSLAELKGNAIIKVEDNGIGISPKDMPHIFEHFYRSPHTKNAGIKASGYGLGLPLAKDIVDLYEGSVHIESVEHEGTKVTINLPHK